MTPRLAWSAWFAWLGGARLVLAQAVVLLAAGVVAVLPRREDWIGSWKLALDSAAGSTVLVGPVAAGLACLVHARLRGSAAAEIIAQSPRDWRCWLQPFAALWALASLALVLVAAGTTTTASLAGVPAYPQVLWVLLPAVAVLGSQVAIGAAIGWSSGRPWAAPLTAVLLFLLYVWTVTGPLPEFFDTGSATVSLAGFTFAPWPSVALGVAGLALATIVLALANRRILLATPTRRGVVGLAVGVWLLSWFTVGDSGERYVPVANPTLTCAGAEPEVCLLAETPRPLADLARKVERHARALRAVGAPLPDRFAEQWDLAPSDDGVVIVNEFSRAEVSDELAIDTLVRPARCAPDYEDGPPEAVWVARDLLARWLQVESGDRVPRSRDPWFAWLTGPAGPREEWVRTTYGQLAACDYDKVRMPGAGR